MDDHDDGEVEYDSGPFCRHWSDPSDCEVVCDNCGHPCYMHEYGDDDTSCKEEDCDCTAWMESET